MNELFRKIGRMPKELKMAYDIRIQVGYLLGRDLKKQVAALDELAKIGKPAVPYLITQSVDPQPSHRSKIAQSLGAIGASEANKHLILMLKQDVHYDVVNTVADVLANNGCYEAIPDLVDLYLKTSGNSNFRLKFALAKLRSRLLTERMEITVDRPSLFLLSQIDPVKYPNSFTIFANKMKKGKIKIKKYGKFTAEKLMDVEKHEIEKSEDIGYWTKLLGEKEGFFRY